MESMNIPFILPVLVAFAEGAMQRHARKKGLPVASGSQKSKDFLLKRLFRSFKKMENGTDGASSVFNFTCLQHKPRAFLLLFTTRKRFHPQGVR